MRDIFTSLGLTELNSGAWSQDGGWSKDTTGPVIESINPATGELLGRYIAEERDSGRRNRAELPLVVSVSPILRRRERECG